MAEVWLATDVSLDRKVALKWLKPSLATDPVVAERFRREAIAVAGLTHPNIVAVHDVFEDDGRQAVVMQLVDGKSLRQLLDVQTRLSPELTIHIGTCVAAGARRRPPRRLRPPRRQAGQHPRHRRRARAAHRLRHRQGPRHLRRRPHERQRDDGHGEVPVARAGPRPQARRSGRPLLARARALRVPRRPGAVPRRDRRRHRARPPAARPDRPRPPAPDDPPRARQPHPPAARRATPTTARRPAPSCAPSCSGSPTSRRPTSRRSASRPGRCPARSARSSGSPQHRPAAARSVPDHGHATTGPTPHHRPARGPGPAPRRSPARRRRRTRSAAAPRDHTPDAGPACAAARHAACSRGPGRRWSSCSACSPSPSSSPSCCGSRSAAATTTAARPATTVAAGAGASTAGRRRTGATIAAVAAYDPDGDGEENDELASAALADGDPATNWRTVCYAALADGRKAGVGLVVSLSRAGGRHAVVRRRQRAVPGRGVRVRRRRGARRRSPTGARPIAAEAVRRRARHRRRAGRRRRPATC